MTDCPCPCHGDSEEGASHEDGDCCPALAEADEALAQALSENGRDMLLDVSRFAGNVSMEFDPPAVDADQLPLWSSVEFSLTSAPTLGAIRPGDGAPLTAETFDRLARHAGIMPWPKNVIPIDRARRRRR